MENLDVATIKKRSINGVLALISRTFILNIISYIASLIVFTILSPSQVGIYIAVTSIQRLISFFTDFGLGAALIQKKDMLNNEDLATTFTIQTFVTGGIFIIIFLARGVIASFFHLENDAMMLLLVLVFTIFLSSFKIIPSILLERKILFHKLIIPHIVEQLAFYGILVALVINNYGLNSYTWAFLISSIISIPFYFYISPWKPTLALSKGSFSHLRYGLRFQAKNVLATIKDDLLTVILAKFLPFSQIGYIGFAQRNSFFAFRYIVDSVTKVSFSTYSRMQENKMLLRSAIEKSLFFVSFTMFPISFGVIVTMPYIIEYFPKWHNKWEPALLSVVFFSLNALVSSFSNILVNVLDATGKVKITLRLMVIWTALTWILTPIFIILYGYNGVAIASFIVTLSIFYTIYLVKEVVVFNFIKSIYKPFLSSCIMIIGVFVASQLFVTNFYTLFIVIAFGACIYFFSMYLMAKEQLKEGLRVILRK